MCYGLYTQRSTYVNHQRRHISTKIQIHGNGLNKKNLANSKFKFKSTGTYIHAKKNYNFCKNNQYLKKQKQHTKAQPLKSRSTARVSCNQANALILGPTVPSQLACTSTTAATSRATDTHHRSRTIASLVQRTQRRGRPGHAASR